MKKRVALCFLLYSVAMHAMKEECDEVALKTEKQPLYEVRRKNASAAACDSSGALLAVADGKKVHMYVRGEKSLEFTVDREVAAMQIPNWTYREIIIGYNTPDEGTVEVWDWIGLKKEKYRYVGVREWEAASGIGLK